ncbi:MAG TPA: hypothetical protein VMR43_08040 [Variovorax sp.]|nr:hypothetical protein [Variovorax sp.]
MTVRCDACGTENRDKAMFCRGCAGKLPAFAVTKNPSVGGADAPRLHAESTGASESSHAMQARKSRNPDRSFLGGAGVMRIALLSLLMVALGASIIWFMRVAAEAGHRVPSILPTSLADDPLPPETSLSPGETLEESKLSDKVAKPSKSSIPTPDTVSPEANAPMANVFPEKASADLEPAVPPRNTGRRSAAATQGGGRALDPRSGCEHLFFAFAARCEANHCQQPAYARHSRCDAVRQQHRRDEARRNSMPAS